MPSRELRGPASGREKPRLRVRVVVSAQAPAGPGGVRLLARAVDASCTQMQRLEDAFRARLNDNVAESAARIRKARLPFYEGLTDAQLSATLARAFEAAAEDVARGEPHALLQRMRDIAVVCPQRGVAVMDVVTGLIIGFPGEVRRPRRAAPRRPRAAPGWEQARAKIAYAGAAVLADTCLAAREAVVRAQSEALVQLSLRVLPLYPGVVVLPLLGELRAERAADHGGAAGGGRLPLGVLRAHRRPGRAEPRHRRSRAAAGRARPRRSSCSERRRSWSGFSRQWRSR